MAESKLSKYPNLKPPTKEVQSRGGKASAAKRRKKKTFREFTRMVLETPVSHEQIKHINEGLANVLEEMGIDPGTIQKSGLYGVAYKWLKEGDLNALKILLELSGEKPAEKVEVEGNISYVNKLKKILGDEM